MVTLGEPKVIRCLKKSRVGQSEDIHLLNLDLAGYGEVVGVDCGNEMLVFLEPSTCPSPYISYIYVYSVSFVFFSTL